MLLRRMQAAVTSTLAFLFLAQAVWAAEPLTHQPEIEGPDHADVSRPVRDVKMLPAQASNVQRPRPRVPQSTIPNNGPDPVIQQLAGPNLNAASLASFGGLGAAGVAPPDTNMAVGPNDIVQWVNLSFAVYDKSGNMRPGYPKAGNALWSGFGGPCETRNDGDPIAQYDAQADRWVMSQLANTSGPTYYQCFAVSTTGDPGGTYNRYAYTFSDLNDYPKIGVWPSGYFASYNMFHPVKYGRFVIGYTFQGARICAYDRAAMMAGSPANSVCFQLSSSFGGLLPSDLDGTNGPPSGSPNFFLNLGINSLNLWKFTPNFSNPNSSTLTGPTSIPVAAFSQPCNGGGACVPQLGTNQQLDSMGDRLMYRLAYRNFGDHQSLVANHSVTAGGSIGVRWYEIRNPNGTPTVFQQGTYAPDGNYRWMGSIAMDKSGNIGVGYSLSSSLLNPSIGYTGRLSTDPLNTMGTEQLIPVGPQGSQTTGLDRWGDYSAMRIDPSDDCTFWYTNEFIPTNGTYNWSTQIASFKFAGCGENLTPTTTTLGAAPANSSVYGQSVTFTATITPSGASGSVTFYDGGVTLGTANLSSGVANLTTSSLSGGPHSITATYGGDSSFEGSSTSSSLPYSVNQAGSLTSLTSSANPSTSGQNVIFTATVTPSGATGTVTFYDNSVILGTGNLNSGGIASFSTSSLSVGMHSITAVYGGDTNFSASTSNAVSQQVDGSSSGDFTLSASPGNVTVKGAATATYTVSVGGSGGFSGTVSLNLSGQPGASTVTFSPSSVSGSGSSTLSVVTTNSTPAGTYTLTITGTSDALIHSTTVRLRVR